MRKVADSRFSWSKSPTSGIVRAEFVLAIDGMSTTVVELETPERESYDVTLEAKSNGTFSIKSYKADGQVATSEQWTFNVGDLEAPLPATNGAFTILNVREVPDDEPVPSGAAGMRVKPRK